MSLIEMMMEPCIVMDKVTERDPEGGTLTSYREGAEIEAVIVCDTSLQARIANADGVVNTYTITTSRDNALAFHDVIKRRSDGAIFRITSESKEKQSPIFSTIDIAQASAESWVIPNDKE